MLALVAALGVVVAGNRALVRETVALHKAAAKTIEESGKHAIAAHVLNHERIFSAMSYQTTAANLRDKGIMHFLPSAEQHVRAEIQALMKATGMTERESLNYICRVADRGDAVQNGAEQR